MATSNEAAIREYALNLIHELLVSNDIQAGYPTADGRFCSLRETPDKVIARIQADWPIGQRPTIGEGVWFTRKLNTTADDI